MGDGYGGFAVLRAPPSALGDADARGDEVDPTAVGARDRVLATIMGGVEVTHTTAANAGSDVLTVNFFYVMHSEFGDQYPPKDSKRREIAISEWEDAELRGLALQAATELGNAGAQLSAGWWRQIGDESRAHFKSKQSSPTWRRCGSWLRRRRRRCCRGRCS